MHFFESITPKQWDDKNIINFHIDINKCRKNILCYSKYDYPVFTVMDKPEKYDQNLHNKPGIYFIGLK